MKTCNGPCALELPLSNFYLKRERNGKMVPRHICKQCQSEIDKKKRAAKSLLRVQEKLSTTEKKCRGKCGNILPLENYRPYVTVINGKPYNLRSNYCRVCEASAEQKRRDKKKINVQRKPYNPSTDYGRKKLRQKFFDVSELKNWLVHD